MKNVVEFSARVSQLLQRSQSAYGIWNQFSTQYMKYTPEQKANGYKKLITALQHPDDDFLYRGTMGNAELQHAVETGYLGNDLYRSGKRSCIDLPSYIRDNDSVYFLSATECQYTAKPYASGLHFPCRGFIIVLGLPKVITMPRTLLQLNEKAFLDYDDTELGGSQSISSGNGGTKRNPITSMTAANNETTIVATEKNWHPTLATDIYKIVEVCGPGKIVGRVMEFAKPMLLDQISNPDFKKRQLSIEIVLNCDDNMDSVIEKGVQEKIFSPDHRFLTLADANAIDKTGMLDQYIEDDGGMLNTIRIKQVPRHIPVGNQKMLQEYMEQRLHETQIFTNMRNISK